MHIDDEVVSAAKSVEPPLLVEQDESENSWRRMISASTEMIEEMTKVTQRTQSKEEEFLDIIYSMCDSMNEENIFCVVFKNDETVR